MIIDSLSDKEMAMLTAYRDQYGYDDYCTEYGVDMPYILREWNDKKTTLFKMLGGNLILQQEIEYEKCREELWDEMQDFRNGYGPYGFGRLNRSGKVFINNFSAFKSNNYPVQFTWEDDYDASVDKIRNGLDRLTEIDCLIENKYDGESFSIVLPNSKKYSISHGCKISKALGKIAESFNLEGYEDFRICHSQILNQKKLTGTLNISIHPMDYFTMSDNNCDWSSCMSWNDYGCYRQGTVEMMNSPIVVVAYLTSGEDMKVPGDYNDEDLFWNSKKWRQLFIVDKREIIGIKDYPYHNNDLSRLVIDWIKELAEKNLGWHYESKPIKFDYNDGPIAVPCKNNKEYSFTTETNNMYNDFGAVDYHWMYLSTDPEDYKCDYDDTIIIDYSGKSECMICGSLDCDFDSEGMLTCLNCQEFTNCELCDEHIGVNDESYEVDGRTICEYCYNNAVHECIVSGEEHLDENMCNIYVISRNFIPNKPENNDWFYGYVDYSPTCWVLDEYLKDFEKEFLIEGAHVELRYLRFENTFVIYFDEIKEEKRRELFSQNYDEKEYQKYLRDWHGVDYMKLPYC